MTALYVTMYGASVRRSGDEVVVSTNGHTIDKAPLRRLDYVVMNPSVQITSQALTALVRQGAQVAYVSGSGELVARVVPPVGGNIQLRYRQYQTVHDSKAALEMARSLVATKIANQRQVLVYRIKNAPQHQDRTKAIAHYLKHQTRTLAAAATLDSLRGVEGNAARHYWKAFADQIRVDGITFDGRKYRPAPDPVNALLSFGYTLLTSRAAAVLETSGLDPAAGFFHGVVYNRPSLALDIIEPFRAPVVDHMVIRLLNLKIFQADDFQRHDSGGVRLSEKARKRFYQEWEETLEQTETLDHLRQQAYDLRTGLLEGAPWRPYTWRAR